MSYRKMITSVTAICAAKARNGCARRMLAGVCHVSLPIERDHAVVRISPTPPDIELYRSKPMAATMRGSLHDTQNRSADYEYRTAAPVRVIRIMCPSPDR